MGVPKTPKDFDYDLWTTESGSWIPLCWHNAYRPESREQRVQSEPLAAIPVPGAAVLPALPGRDGTRPWI